MNEWISVKERIPDWKDGQVLVLQSTVSVFAREL